MNKKTWLVRVKTLQELRKEIPDVDEYHDATLEVFHMLSKYGGRKMHIYSTENKEEFRSEIIDNDKNLKLRYEDRTLYESEIESIENIFKLDNGLFEL